MNKSKMYSGKIIGLETTVDVGEESMEDDS